MDRKLSLIIIGSAALVACNKESHTIVGGDQPDPMKDELAKAAPVELPPAIASTKTYRCKDNSLVRIDWLQGGKGAYLHGEATTRLTSRLPKQPRVSRPTPTSRPRAALC